MAKKQKSFAEKASSSKGKDLVHVKFVKSVPSDKEGFWRFNESMIGLEKGQQLDAALKQMEEVKQEALNQAKSIKQGLIDNGFDLVKLAELDS